MNTLELLYTPASITAIYTTKEESEEGYNIEGTTIEDKITKSLLIWGAELDNTEIKVDYLDIVNNVGYIELRDGVYLHSQESIIDDQKEWAEEDKAKTKDFTTSPYWLITDDGKIASIDSNNDVKSKL